MIHYTSALARDGAELGRLARVNPRAQVPTCPAWEVADLVEHVGRVYATFLNILDTLPAARPESGFDTAVPAAVLDWFDVTHEDLCRRLETTSHDTEVWTWTARRDVGFYARRAAHETSVHLVDVQLALGMAVDLDSELACDGIDEALEVGMVSRFSEARVRYPDSSLHLHRTDGPGEWMLTATEGRMKVTHEHGKADAAVKGSAPSLLLYLWGRGHVADLETFGPMEVVQEWGQLTA